VFEPIGTFFQIIDPSKGNFKFGDQSLHQISAEIDGKVYLIVMRMWPKSLAHHLKNLSRLYELVIFTILPAEIMKKILTLIPDSDSCIAHCLCKDDLIDNIFKAPMVCKDLSLLAA
jgi:TFIIF-interacting CTD phosphatase-like protein